MKTKSSVLKSLVIVSAFLLPLNLMAQDDVGGLFKSSPADATKLVDAYMAPLFKGLGAGLNSGWHNTAKTKGTLRFDLRITFSAALVPDEDKSYNTNTLGLTTIKPASGSNGIGPTAFGDDNAGAQMELYANGTATGQKFNLPQGTGISVVPAPQLQLTVGLIKHIDLSIRLVPNVKLGDDAGSLNQFGLGAKVELLPLLMGKKDKLLPFDLALALGFTNTNYKLPLDINSGKYTNQLIDVKFKGFQAEAIISKKLLFFTPFASVGYNSARSSLNALGTYEFDVPVTPATPTGKQAFTDPVSLKHSDLSGMKASLGFQLNLAFFRIYGSYTASKYSYFNGGIGFGFGK
jgi:hypothetical protein